MVKIKGLESGEGINKLILKIREHDIDIRVLRADVSGNTVEYVATKNVSKLQILTALTNNIMWNKLKSNLQDKEKVDDLQKAKEVILQNDLSGINEGDNLGVVLQTRSTFKEIEGIDPGILLQCIISLLMMITFYVNAK